MKIPFLDLRTQYLELKKEIDQAVARTLDSGWYIGGKEVETFEQAMWIHEQVDRPNLMVASMTPSLTRSPAVPRAGQMMRSP